MFMFNKPFAFTDNVQRTTWVDNHGVYGDRDVVYMFFMGIATSGKQFKIMTKLSDANRWLNGELIQNCFPHLNADEREILMTGIDGDTWEEMFAGSEEDEE
jgi:hypothetical protein